MPIDSVIHTNQQSIDRVLQTGLPVLLVFWRQGAAPSGQTDAALQQLAERYAGRALIAKVDAAAEPGLVKRFAVGALPGFVPVKAGKAEATLPGHTSDADLRAWLTHLVEGGPRPAVTAAPGATAPAQPHVNGHTPRRPSSGPQSASSTPVTLTDSNFQQVIAGPGPVLVDFWAAWCGPCRMVAPSVDALAKEFAGRAVVGKLNVDENPATAQRYNIMSIPALLIFKNGRVVDQIVGAQPLPALRAKLAQHAG
ncbi:MAG: thioredoxin [Caldilineaceae bacterium]|nr:thioredoxin [Caldilineaceae bacterium]